MPILVPAPAVADGVHSTQSPYWLRINGAWVRLEGVTPGSEMTAERPRSELVVAGGFRFAQQAPRAAREWSLEFQHATPAAIAAVGLAAEASEVLLLDSAAASANMLHPTDAYGSGPGLVDCGGIVLPAYGADDVTVTTPIRGDVTMAVSVWSDADAGTEVADVTWPGGSGVLLSVATLGVPARCELAFAATVDGDLEVSIAGGVGYDVSGLVVVEGSTPPMWLAGERTPCQVAVGDPSRTLSLARSGRLSRSEYSVTLREVG